MAYLGNDDTDPSADSPDSGHRSSWAVRLAGALFGAVPGLLFWITGLVVTGGGDGMILFGMGGIGLTLVGLVIGATRVSRRDTWISRNAGVGLIAGLVTVVLLVIWLFAIGSGPPR